MTGVQTCALPIFVPSRRIARSWTDQPLPFGLDEPMRLLGRSAASIDTLAEGLALEWAPNLQRAVVKSCLVQSAEQRPWFRLPATALVARPGAGRTLMARILARSVELPFAIVDVSQFGAPEAKRRAAPDVALPTAPVLVMAASRCANPVVLLTGTDDAGPEALETVRRLVDPAANARWSEPGMQASVDLSQVTWLLQCSSMNGLPRQLSAVVQEEPVEVEGWATRLRAICIVEEVLREFDADPRAKARAFDKLPARIADDRSSAASHHRLIAEAAVRAFLSTDA